LDDAQAKKPEFVHELSRLVRTLDGTPSGTASAMGTTGAQPKNVMGADDRSPTLEEARSVQAADGPIAAINTPHWVGTVSAGHERDRAQVEALSRGAWAPGPERSLDDDFLATSNEPETVAERKRNLLSQGLDQQRAVQENDPHAADTAGSHLSQAEDLVQQEPTQEVPRLQRVTGPVRGGAAASIQGGVAAANLPRAANGPLLALPTPPPGLALEGLFEPAVSVAGPTSVPKAALQRLPTIGLDFGTAVIRYAVDQRLVKTSRSGGYGSIPALIAFPGPGVVHLAEHARERLALDYRCTVSSPRRLLGLSYSDPQVTTLLSNLSLRSFEGTDHLVRFEIQGEVYSAADICALLIKEARSRAKQDLGCEPDRAVVTVPVSFGPLQRTALESALWQSGLEPVMLISEAKAAVVAYGLEAESGLGAVYDLGAGSFELSLFRLRGGHFDLVGCGSDPWLGGDDFDHALGCYVAQQVLAQTGLDLRAQAATWYPLLASCEAAKRGFLSASEIAIAIPRSPGRKPDQDAATIRVSRQRFFELTAHLVERTLLITKRVMEQEAGVRQRELRFVILCGGASMLPNVRDGVAAVFGTERLIEGRPDRAIVHGAALKAALIDGQS
jgi:hypothetical protein